MIQAIALLFSFQLAGEAAVRALGLTLPGPVLGMAGLLALFLIMPKAYEIAAPTAQGLLGHLSLLFVPAGVGIVGHLGRLGADGGPVAMAILASTALAIAVGALVFSAVARLTGDSE